MQKINCQPVLNRQGMTLIEVVIGIGLLGFMSLVFAQMMANQNKQMHRLETKAAVLEAQNFIRTALQDNAICSKQFSDPALGALKNLGAQTGLVNLSLAGTDINNPLIEKIQLQKVLLGSVVGSAVALEVGKPIPGTTSAVVSEISISNFVKKSSADDIQYSADLVASFAEGSGPIKPLKVRLSLSTNSSAITQRAVVSCQAGGGSGTIGSLDALPAGVMAGSCVRNHSEDVWAVGRYNDDDVYQVQAPGVQLSGPGRKEDCGCSSGWALKQINKVQLSTGSQRYRNTYTCIKQ